MLLWFLCIARTMIIIKSTVKPIKQESSLWLWRQNIIINPKLLCPNSHVVLFTEIFCWLCHSNSNCSHSHWAIDIQYFAFQYKPKASESTEYFYILIRIHKILINFVYKLKNINFFVNECNCMSKICMSNTLNTFKWD